MSRTSGDKTMIFSEDDDIGLPSSLSPSPEASQHPPSLQSPASTDKTMISFEDDDISLHSSPSPSPDASQEPYASSSDGSDTGALWAPKKRPWAPNKRLWPPADELALLEAVAAHQERHGRYPSPDDLVTALRGRLQVSSEQLARRVDILRHRYCATARQLSRGVIPVTDNDLKILGLSRRIWEGSRKGKRKPRDSGAHHERRSFVELAKLYPCLAAEVEVIEARKLPRGTAGVLKRAFGCIGDERATELEAKAKKQRLAEVKVSMRRAELRNMVAMKLVESIE